LDEVTTLTSGGALSDMDRWLEHVFDQALDGTVDELDDERTLSGRLKGGGDNRNHPQPKVNTAPLLLLPLNSIMCQYHPPRALTP